MDNHNNWVNMPLIKVEGLSKSYVDSGVKIEILQAVDFQIDQGETIAVVGASGIGKSTLLHLLGTLDRPDKGKLLIRGEDVYAFDTDKLSRFRNEFIGFVFQFHHLLPEFTALENVMIPSLIKCADKRSSATVAEEILVRVGLKERLHHRVTDLSGGEQQRVALARALVLNPVILLADEPTGNLDKNNSAQVHDLLMELNRERRMTLIVVTHNMELAAYMSRRLTISDSKIIETA